MLAFLKNDLWLQAILAKLTESRNDSAIDFLSEFIAGIN